MTKKKRPAQRWGYVFYEERGDAPAYAWLLSLPNNIRTEFMNTIEAVLLSDNPRRAGQQPLKLALHICYGLPQEVQRWRP